jgi:4'-phosphopantetheinyl transferase
MPDHSDGDVSSHRASLTDGISTLPADTCGIELWLIDLVRYPFQEKQSWLSAVEMDRASRFKFQDDRRRYLAAHCALREIIGLRLDRPPASLQFLELDQGKPALLPESGQSHNALRFSLSHGEDLALIGLADGFEIGVDIESLRAIDDIWPLAEQCLTRMECEELRATPSQQLSSAFLRGWTRKEACLKAIGTGLSLAPNALHTGLGLDLATTSLTNDHGPATVHVRSIDIDGGSIAAVAWIPA